MRLLDLFSGIGGFSLAASWVWGDDLEIVGFVENDKFCQKVLKKHWPNVLICEDIKELDGTQFKPVDIITGGFPCQDVSVCGKQKGIFENTRSGLWKEAHRVLGIYRPPIGLFENVPGLLCGGNGRWFESILIDLARIGYNAQWETIPASAIGACHERKRIWILAYPIGSRLESLDLSESLRTHTLKSPRREFARAINAAIPADDYIKMRGDYDDVSGEMDRLKSLGNAIVPQVVVPIFQAIKEIENETS